MSGKHISALFILSLTLAISNGFVRAIGLEEIASYSYAQTPTLDEIEIKDIDYDGKPEILIRSGAEIFLYSMSSADSEAVFSATLDPADDYAVALGDVNRDSIGDISCALYHEISGYSDTTVRIISYNGADAFGTHSEAYLPSYEGSVPSYMFLNAIYDISGFDALDVDADGYSELAVSYAISLADGFAYDFHTLSWGNLHIFHTFPDSTLCQYSTYLKEYQLAKHLGHPYLFGIGMSYEVNVAHILGFNDTHFALRGYRIDSTGVLIVPDSSSRCPESGVYDDWSSWCVVECGAIGNIVPGDEGLEVLMRMSWRVNCFEPDLGSIRQGVIHGLWRLDASGQGENLWYADRDIRQSVVHPGLAGGCLVWGNGKLVRIDGASGAGIDSIITLPPCISGWIYPFGNREPYLYSREGTTIKIFKIVGITDAGSEAPLPLPATLSLGKPYPNPFNATQTIPVTVKPGNHLTVEIYDILGRKVERLFDGDAESSEFNLTWNASAHASGVYFVKATCNENSAVVRSLLIK
jgi:hypothetical protein